MSQIEARVSGNGVFLFKMALALIYTALCAVAEKARIDLLSPEVFGIGVAAVVLTPLAICAILYAVWWRKADEYQKVLEYRAVAGAGLGGVAFLIGCKLATYFFQDATHVPSLAVTGMVLLYWI